jgi:acetoin utilization protein AcuB
LRNFLLGTQSVRGEPRKMREIQSALCGTEVADAESMSKAIPSIQKYMTTSPHTIGADQTLAHAHAVLREFKIRHLPVLRGGQLVGMITERDLALVEALKDVDPQNVLVEDAMSLGVYTVTPDAPIDEVVGEMAAKKFGSAVVQQNHKVVGIFTTVDVCKAFAELLHGRLTH